MQGTIRGGQPLEYADTGPSRRLWQHCPWDDIGRTIRGVKFEDYFNNTPDLSTTAVTGKYNCFADPGCTIQQSTNVLGGVTLTVDVEDDQAAEIQAGNPGGQAKFIDPIAAGATPYDVWFECRFELSALVGNCFFGLMEPFTPAGDHITNGGVLADKGLIGFSTLEATPTVLNFTYKKNGQTVQVPITTVNTMVAATAVSVGFHYRIVNPNDRKIMVFKNNVLQTGGVTKAQIEAAAFPDNILMSLTAAIKNVTDITAATLYWWRFAMVEN